MWQSHLAGAEQEQIVWASKSIWSAEPRKTPFIYSWPIANTAKREDKGSIRIWGRWEMDTVKGCWSLGDIKAPSGVAVMKRLSGFIITSAGKKKSGSARWLSELTKTLDNLADLQSKSLS